MKEILVRIDEKEYPALEKILNTLDSIIIQVVDMNDICNECVLSERYRKK